MIIYQIRCLIDNRVYIGQTKNIKKRWQGHLSLVNTGKGYWIHSAIRKYGLDKFVLEIIKENATNQDEIKLIKETRDYNFNIHTGGKGGDNITFHPNKLEIFEKRKDNHLQNVRRKENHPKWVKVDENIKQEIIRLYFSYSLPSPQDICTQFNIKKDVFNRIIREKHLLFRSQVQRFSFNTSNIEQLISEYKEYTIQAIRQRGCGLSESSIPVVLQKNGVTVKKGKR